MYELEQQPLPQIGKYDVILDSTGEAVCIIQTKKVYVTPFCDVTEEHAYKEGEGDRSLDFWRKTHQ
ncbi:MAG: ASCH domain-containing protein, partial [Candidatus Fournierella pullistercoris]|nr:ASCH domain-containing protein [Candidatus Fournierella pullistercoris]